MLQQLHDLLQPHHANDPKCLIIQRHGSIFQGIIGYRGRLLFLYSRHHLNLLLSQVYLLRISKIL